MTIQSIDALGRLRAAKCCKGLALLFLLCATSACNFSAAGPVRTLLATVGVYDADVSSQAAYISFASIRFEYKGRGGLLVLSEAADTLTFWQTASRQTIVLNGAYLDHTSGLEQDLLETRIPGVDNAVFLSPWALWSGTEQEYEIVRRWVGENGDIVDGRAKAKLNCNSELEEVELPLTTLNLRRCEERLQWPNGDSTVSLLWVSPKTGRIWQGESQPWPGAGRFEWQVARPWW